MKQSARARVWVQSVICCVFSTFRFSYASGADRPDELAIVKQARQAQYSLAAQGLTGFQSGVQINWRLALQDQLAANPAAGEATLKYLNGIHFRVSLGSDGVVQVTHHTVIEPGNQKMAEYCNQISSGMEEGLTAFFHVWQAYMVYGVFPNVDFPDVDSDYQLRELNGEYHLSYKSHKPVEVAIAITMSKDFVIHQVTAENQTLESVLKPAFTPSRQGFLLTGYDDTRRELSGKDTVRLRTQIDYHQVNGFALPHKVSRCGSYNGEPAGCGEWTFTDYRVTSR
jgi:hypothetical protein